MTAWLNEAAALWWPWMTGMFWQAGLLILLVSLVDWAFGRRMWPQVRYALWLVIMIKLVVPPTWSSSVSLVSRIRPHIQNTFSETQPARYAGFEMPAKLSQTADKTPESTIRDGNPVLQPESSIPASSPIPQIQLSPKAKAMLLWLTGMVIFGLLLILKMVRLRRWHARRRQEEIPDWFHRLMVDTARKLGLSRIPAIVFSRDAVTPAVYGLFRPVLLLPSGYADSLSREEAEHVLLHELCHLKRGDLWMHGLYLILHVIYWFNPFLLWTRRQMKHVREICCDLSVAAVLRDKTQDYRQTLLDTARELLTKNVEPGMGLLGVFEEPFRLVARLKWLEKETWKFQRRAMAASLLAVAGLFVLIVPMSSSQPNADQSTSSIPIDRSTVNAEVKTDSSQAISDLTITLKKTDAFTAVILPKTGPPTSQLESAMAELVEVMKKQDIEPTGRPFFRLWSDPKKVSENQFVWEVGCPVLSDEEPKPPLEFIRVSEQHAASAMVEGVLETEPVWEVFIKRIEDMGLVPAFPPAVEWYGTEEKGKPFWWKTELQMQAFQPRQGYPGMDIKIRKSEPALAVVLPVQGSYSQIKESRERVLRYIKDQDISTSGEMIWVNFSDPLKVKPSEYLWEIGCIVNSNDSLRIDPPFEPRYYHADTVATAGFDGPPDTEFPFTAFIMQTFFQGYLIKGPAVLTWNEKPGQNPEDVKHTDLSFLVMRVENFAIAMEAFGRGIGESIRQTMDADSIKTQTMSASEAPEPKKPSDSRGNESARGGLDFLGRLGDWFKGLAETGVHAPLFRIENRNTFWAILLPASGSMDQLPIVFETLRQYMTANGIQSAGLPFMRQFYSAEVVKPYEALWDAAYPLKDSTAVKPPFRMKRIPAGSVIALRYSSSIDQKSLNIQIASWLYHNNYKALLPNRIIWTNGIPNLGAAFRKADIEIPIQKVDDPLPDVRIFTRTEADRRELILPMTGSWNGEDDAIKTLKRYVEEKGFEIMGDVFVQYHTSPEATAEADMIWDVGVPIREESRVKDPFRIEWRSGRMTACAEWSGNHLKIPESFWTGYMLNCTLNGYLAGGYPRKVFKKALPSGQWKVELQWPVSQ